MNFRNLNFKINFMDNQAFVLQRTFNAPVSKVWTALTDKDEMKKWYFDLAEFKAEKGFVFTFTAGPEWRNSISSYL